MRSRLALLAIALLAVGGLIALFHQRFQSSDLYPRYSSLRSDPRGLKILFEGLEQTGALDVERGYHPLGEWHGKNAAFIVAGVDPYWWLNAEANLQVAEHLARLGNRVVVSLDEEARPYERANLKEQPLAKQWGLTLETIPRAGKDDEDEEYRPWPFFFHAGKEWRVLRMENGHPVIIERTFDAGTVVLMASSWLLTNDAMVEDRQSTLLITLLGGKPRVRFDESHLGIEETGTILALARRFHLQGFLTGLFLIAALFIWRNAGSFPPRRDRGGSGPAAGRDSLTGLAILLQRHLSEQAVLASCLREREKAGEKRPGPGVLREMQALARFSTGATPGFLAIQDLLHSKRKFI
jgi:hypothetical protein